MLILYDIYWLLNNDALIVLLMSVKIYQIIGINLALNTY